MGRVPPSPPTESPGLFNTSALFNGQVRDLNNFALTVPVFSGIATATQSITGGNTMTPLSFDTELLDPDGGHSTVTNPSRYTATVPGTYLVIGTVGWIANTTGDRRLQIGLNSAAVAGSGTSLDPTQVVICGMLTAATVTMNGTTDFVEVMAAQNSGGALNTNPTAPFSCSMRVIWISR
jgi:hypothetical protein